MANASTPNGAVPVRSLTGPYEGNTNAYSTAAGDATLIGIGDFVKLVGTSQLIGDITYADVARAATGDVIVGVVTSVSSGDPRFHRVSCGFDGDHRQRGDDDPQLCSKYRRARAARHSPRTILA
jgi:hypothetical protein